MNAGKKDMSEKRILMAGNEAIAEGAIQAGLKFYAGYPITPQNELTAYMAEQMPKRNNVFIQAESELPWNQPEAGRHLVYGGLSAARSDRQYDARRPGIGEYLSVAVGLFPGDKRRRPWRLPYCCTCTIFGPGML